MTARLKSWIENDPDFELMAPVPFSLVCFRYRPAELAAREEEPEVAGQLDELNLRLMNAVTHTGRAFLSHTRVNDRFTIRLNVSNLRIEDSDLDLVWEVVRREAAALGAAAQ
jgi:aromatic-L-amino-acid decarboxylase